MQKWWKGFWTLGAILCVSMAVADKPATAQEGRPPEETDDSSQDSEPAGEKAEEIVITGSRIRTNPLDASSPVLNLSEGDLDRTGMTSVADMLQRLPVSGGALNTKFNSSGNFGFPADGGGIGAGSAQADLRYLGSNRVLVLVDGVRWVNGSSASGVSMATDLNTIPVGIIERVEILEDGASSVYGSDAISGVINIITKKEIDGFEANAYVGGYHPGDGFQQQYDLTWGNTTDKMSVSLNLSYIKQGEIIAADREMSKWVTPGIGKCSGRCSSGTPQGRMFFTDPNTGKDVDVTIDTGIDGIPFYDPLDPGGNADDFHPFDTPDRFNFAPYNRVLTPSERFGAFSQLEYKVNEYVNINVKSLYNNRQSKNQAAPEPLFIGPGWGNNSITDFISIHESNPYNPFGFTLDAKTNEFGVSRRPIEAGPRIYRQNVNTWYLSGGANGSFRVADSSFYWDTTMIYSVNRADQIKNGAFNAAKLANALGPAFYDPDANMYRCGTPDNVIQGCVPFNIFGGMGSTGSGTITREMLDYVTFVQKDVSQQTLVDITANVSGDLLELPAGNLGMAVGYEYRKHDGFFQPDSVVVSGDTAGIPASPTSGGFYVNEAYAEIKIPILADQPGFDLLDLSGAVRFSDYSTFGMEETFKAGLRWRAMPGLMFRGTYAQGFRAPGIGELFSTAARYDQTLVDPCSDFLGSNQSQEIINNCIQLGVPADGSYEMPNSQIAVITGGNRDLQPETSQGVTASIVFSPTWIMDQIWGDQLELEITYFRIQIDDAIRAKDAQVQLDTCVSELDQEMCSGISRTKGGVINGFYNQLINIGGIETDGWDVTLRYMSPQTPAGRFGLTWISNFLKNFTVKIEGQDGLLKIQREGTEVGDPEQAYPKFKTTFIADWSLDDLSASATARYIHSVKEPCRGFDDFPGLCSDPVEPDDLSTNMLDPTWYLDLQLTWTPSQLDQNMFLTIGVNNLFNQDPPICMSCALNGFDASTYDVPGIYGYMRAGYRM